jgi:hypothetical protein
MKFADYLDWRYLLDWLYPTVEPLSEEKCDDQRRLQQDRLQFAETHTDPEAIAKGYAELCAEEAERLKSVETRLGSILGLTSITSSLLIGGIFAIVNGGLSDSSRSVRFVACAALVYLSLQIISSTLAAIQGLGRASWIGRSIEDYVACSEVGPAEQHRQTALRNCRRLLQMGNNINAKVTQMAVAHAAIRNFASASVLIAVLGCAAVLMQQPGSAATKAIRTNPDLQKLLQGPPGPKGPQGPKGDPGASITVSHKRAVSQRAHQH